MADSTPNRSQAIITTAQRAGPVDGEISAGQRMLSALSGSLVTSLLGEHCYGLPDRSISH